jgi:hypothetical protein
MRQAVVLCALLAALVAAGSAAAKKTPLAGVFEVTVKGPVAQLNGTWLLSFAPSGVYAIVKEPKTKQLLSGGSSSIKGKTITFVNKKGPLACPGASAKGTYSWHLSGKRLKLTKIADLCDGRPPVLTSETLTKVR